jgi:preprotein translocase subunit SecA
VSSLITRPGATFGLYPERDPDNPGVLEQAFSTSLSAVRSALRPLDDEVVAAVAEIEYHRSRLESASATGIARIVDDLRIHLARDGQTDSLAAAVFALVREVARRELDIAHSPEHLACGWALFKGMLAEVEPGEDKSLAALLPACTAALAGIPVHIITGDDYLAHRDAYRMRPVFVSLGLSVGEVNSEMSLQHRRAAYRCDVTYGAARQFAMDYLQDRLLLQSSNGKLQQQVERLKPGQPLQEKLRLQGLCYAIVDQAATTLVDEASTPLLLADSDSRAASAGADPEITARISLPQFFKRYLKLCGMSGTLRELAPELRRMYQLEIYPVPLHEPSQRRYAPDQVFPDRASKWQAILERIIQRQGRGQPVLVGTRSRADSEHLSALLTSAGIVHQVLDAQQPTQAAAKLAGAGAPGSVTIAGYRDGLGTDIAMGERARELGGLHIILSERFDTAHMDRQFAQRCARRGNPGSVAAMLSLEDELAVKFLSPAMRKLAPKLGQRAAASMLRLAQARQEQERAIQRRGLERMDRQLEDLLAFSGRKH